MDQTPPVPLAPTLTQLADQWTVLRERYAFLSQALLRLVSDHPDIASDVIQGATQYIEDTGRTAMAFSRALGTLREQAQTHRRQSTP